MRKIVLFVFFGLLCLCLSACNGGSGVSDENTLKLGAWGESQELAFAEKDGKVFVVNAAGEEVLDVTDYPQTDILSDEFTGETRLIKTYTLTGTDETSVDCDVYFTVNVYSYNYYTPQGKLIVENSEHNIVSIVNGFGFVEYPSDGQSAFYLKTGKRLGHNESFYLSQNGVVANGGDCKFFNRDGKKAAAHVGMYITGYLPEYDRNEYVGRDSWNGDMYSSSLKAHYGFAPERPKDTEESVAKERDELFGHSGADGEYYDLLDKAEAAKEVDASLLIFQTLNSLDYRGLVDENGKIIKEAEYLGFAICGDDTVVAFGENKTEILNRDDFSVRETLPYRMSYYDGENSVVQVDDYSFYLADAKGNQIAPMNNGVQRVDMGEAGVRFLTELPGSWEEAMLDRAGNQLYILPYEPNVTYVDGGILAIHSRAGMYTTDIEGNITKIICLWDGYTYDEVNNVINGEDGSNVIQ